MRPANKAHRTRRLILTISVRRHEECRVLRKADCAVSGNYWYPENPHALFIGTVAPFSIALGGALHGRDCLASVDRRKHRKAAVDIKGGNVGGLVHPYARHTSPRW